MVKKAFYIFIALMLFVLAVISVFASPLVGPEFIVRSELVLPAKQRASWQLLTDFQAYPEWNPYLIRVEGTFDVNEVLTVDLIDGNFDELMTVRPTVSEISTGKSFCWKGRLVLPGLFDTRHCFVLQHIAEAETRLQQFEEFSGLIPTLVPAEETMAPHVEAAFQAMHQAMLLKLQTHN